jgi:hypothetical protein
MRWQGLLNAESLLFAGRCLSPAFAGKPLLYEARARDRRWQYSALAIAQPSAPQLPSPRLSRHIAASRFPPALRPPARSPARIGLATECRYIRARPSHPSRGGMGPRRRHGPASSLVAVVQALEGHKVIVELRNDVVLRGMLESVDQYLK